MTQSDAYLRPDPCQHPTISDEMLTERAAEIEEAWGAAQPLQCSDCREWLYLHRDDADRMTVDIEPWGT